MEITMKWLLEHNACESARKLWRETNDNDHQVMLRRLIDREHYDYASWLIVRVMARKSYLLYSAYATELSAPNYEREFPGSDVIRRCVAAVRAVAENDTAENRSAVWSVWSAESAARSATESAESAALDKIKKQIEKIVKKMEATKC